jgi:Uma2 family endonuclease
MSTVERPERRVLPPLVAGQRLDQPTFHERYEAMPPETRAELVGGIVYMPSPLSGDHGVLDDNVAGWLFHYRRFTPGLWSGANVTTKLGTAGETQPDNQLRIPEAAGGQTRIDEGGYVLGPPELVIEIARSSLPFDLGAKQRDYERARVREYLVLALDPNGVHWFALRGDQFEDLPPGPDGLFRSEVFPGLWLDPTALFAGDLDGLIAALERGLATAEHAAFAAKLAEPLDQRG